VLSLRQRFCLAIGASIIADAGLDATALGGWAADHVARARGEHELHLAAVEALRDAYGVTSRDALMAWARDRLPARRELAHVVAAFSIATLAQYVSEDDAWQAILLAGKLAQTTYRSWDELAATCAPVSDEVRAQWAALPWTTELDVTVLDPAAAVGVARSACPRCGARPTRRSPTAYVYCDQCGCLADYDFERACAQPLERPGPAYEAIYAELAPALAAAHDDLPRTRAIQRALFDAWVDACPGAQSVRVQDPAYRAAWVAMLAEGETRAAFDPEARARRAAMADAAARLGFVTVDGRPRVLVEPYRVMEAAMFAHEARRHELAIAHKIYEMHPDHAPPALIRRIGFSTYAQGWLPYLADADAQALLARTGLAQTYDVAAPPAIAVLHCPRCDRTLEIDVTASRIVCAHCGRPIDVPKL
jgi:Protein of unknown function (DUF1266)